jgi:hypothetical protein
MDLYAPAPKPLGLTWETTMFLHFQRDRFRGQAV